MPALRYRTPLLLVITIVATAMLTAGFTVAFANHNASHKVFTGKGVTQVKVLSSSSSQATTTKNWATVAGSATTIKVPKGQKALLLLRVSGVSMCSGNTAGSLCLVRAMVDGDSAFPEDAASVFDSSAGGALTESAVGARSREWVVKVGAGTHDVELQMASCATPFFGCGVDPGPDFALHDWVFTIERIRA